MYAAETTQHTGANLLAATDGIPLANEAEMSARLNYGHLSAISRVGVPK